MKPAVFLLALIALTFSFPARAHEHEPHAEEKPAAAATEEKAQEVQVTVTQIGENVHLLQGQGGNIAVWTGADGAVMIDADFIEVTPTVLKAVASFTDKNISYLVNTHWHGDHTGGNSIVGAASAKIIAHDNVRPRLSVDNFIAAFDMNVKAQPPAGLPQITFNDTLTLHLNGADMKLVHIPAAHTDGDAFIYLPSDNIIHTGDIYFNGIYPFIDSNTGGSLDGMIAGADKILEIADDNTKIIAGHGPLSNKTELKAYRDMLVGVRDKIKPLVDAGKSLEDIAAENLLAEFNAQWGDGFLPPEKWLGIVVAAMKPAAPVAK